MKSTDTKSATLTPQARFLAGKLDRIQDEGEREQAMFRALGAINARVQTPRANELTQLLRLTSDLEPGEMKQLLGYATGLALGSGKTRTGRDRATPARAVDGDELALLGLFRRLDGYRKGRARAELEMLCEDLERDAAKKTPKAGARGDANVIQLFPRPE